MDSFTIFFPNELSDADICTAIHGIGADAVSLGARAIVASRGTANVWLDCYGLADMAPSRFDDQETWPLQKDQVRIVMQVSVRRNEESNSLAMEIAHQLVSNKGGAIAWEGNRYWQALYERTYQHDSKVPR